MKALTTLKSAINQSSLFGIFALVLLVPIIFPHLVSAAELQTSGQQALVFEIKDSSKIQTQNLLTFDQLAKTDPLVQNLQDYLDSYNSPLKDYSAQLVTLPNWKKVIAISFVESNMCVHSYNNNCSGMGGAPGTKTWRKYSDYLEWAKDLDALLSKPMYTEKHSTFEKMNGFYVVPGSKNWVYGTNKIYMELTGLENQSIQERLALTGSYQLALAK